MRTLPQELKNSVLKYVQENPQAKKGDISQLFGISRMTLRSWVAGGWPADRRQKLLTQQKEKMAKSKFILIQFLGGQCEECGYRGCDEALEFHHKDPSKKKEGVSNLLSGKFEVAVEEAKKCRLLCGNCHQELHAQEC